ncbi:unnamed protein product [Bursaphelenchus xylophilus]|uniref:(pine wood nematode) hypothetical protein n=1 Tax=Bursaphelenchus xylophilus TaxID=6326 RepID=A0A1I7RZN9_BURXY|nr:unnamed protein product [Bursaphelenchus xylophilus]CAG9111483.1 unnamed protein product [Bursaphelenchus xylophilus]
MAPQGGTPTDGRKEQPAYMKYGHVTTNGVTVPPIGLGCWMGNATEDEVRKTLWNALDAGYRYFDTATLYGNEHIVGEVLKNTAKAIESSLKVLGVDYLDMYLMHTPLPFKPNDDCTEALRDLDGSFIVEDTPLSETWRVLEKYYHKGIIRSLGVSNFSIPQIQDILDNCEVPPHNLQMEVHIYLAQENLVNFCKSNGITVTGYSTLGSPGRKDNPVGSFIDGSCLDEPLVRRLAEKYADMEELSGLDQDKHFFPFDFAYHHPNYPYQKPVDQQ